MNDRNYLIIDSSEISKINFSKILETSEDTLRFSVDRSKCIIKWSGEEPDFVDNLLIFNGPYSHSEIIDIVKSEEWTQVI
jgi:hypothetical protein